jgi:transcriptional regulator with XRE-family HTH domain
MTPEQFKGGRVALGLTQAALGAFLGVSMRQVRRYETGESVIPGPLAILIDILIDKRIPKIGRATP